ncbi:MAG: aminopeptidase P family protein [Candidatus Eremiobacteraeota bacterium]|nr:aminopeptidase P family protein [Candidatus Eremiobacteraeota bacterium]
MSGQREIEISEHESQAAHDIEPPAALIDFMARDWIDRPAARAVHPEARRFEERRKALSRRYPGEYLVVPAGPERMRAGDTNYAFRPASDFVYLVGDGEPGALLVLEPRGAEHRAVLFVRAHNRGTKEFFTDRFNGELWVGSHRGVEESRRFFGVEEARSLADLAAYLQDVRDARYPVRVVRGVDEAIDGRFDASDGDRELAEHLSEMRLIKDEYELAELRKACAITKRAFEDAIRAMRNGANERAIEAAFWSRARIEGNDTGYLTIAGAGAHACTLHWTRNDGELRAGDLLLIDAGAECDSFYTADITRTLPISGGFTERQRAVYDVVWQAQQAAIEAVAPGNDFLEPYRRAMRVLAGALIDWGILTGSVDEVLDKQRQFQKRYTLHGVSHMLGIDVHDCSLARSSEYRYGKLREGMVLTVEPGLYFQPDDATVPEELRGIGVRIEDDVAVTAAGCEVLSRDIPSRARDVERWIAGAWTPTPA